MTVQFKIIDVRANFVASSLESVKEDKENGNILIGVEVTEQDFAELMDYNIDPQHEDQDAKMSAIKWTVANGCDLLNELLNDSGVEVNHRDVCFYTIRPDLDSIGSMFILSELIDSYLWSSYLVENDIYFCLNEDTQERISLIHDADCFIGKGQWKAGMLGTGYNNSVLAPVARMVQDYKVPLEKRVNLIGEWLISGKFETIDSYKNAVEKEREEIKNAVESGETRCYSYRSLEKTAYYPSPKIGEGEHISDFVIVESKLRAATSIGYDKAPIVICFNPEMPHRNSEGTYRKFTICQYNVGYIEMEKVKDELNNLEQGWGGSPLIIGSPQEKDSNLSIYEVANIVAKYIIV